MLKLGFNQNCCHIGSLMTVPINFEILFCWKPFLRLKQLAKSDHFLRLKGLKSRPSLPYAGPSTVHPLNFFKIPLKLPWNTFIAKIPWTIFIIPLEHPWNTLETLWDTTWGTFVPALKRLVSNAWNAPNKNSTTDRLTKKHRQIKWHHKFLSCSLQLKTHLANTKGLRCWPISRPYNLLFNNSLVAILDLESSEWVPDVLIIMNFGIPVTRKKCPHWGKLVCIRFPQKSAIS